MKYSIFDKIIYKKIKTEAETINVWQLGVFDNSMYELVELVEGQYYPPHKHNKSEAKLHIIFGKGIIIINKKENNYKKGDMFFIPKGISHGFRVKKQTLLLSINTPPIIDSETGEVDVEYLGVKK